VFAFLRYLLKASRLTRGEPLFLAVPTFGEVLSRISIGGHDAGLVEVPLHRGVDVLTRQRLTVVEAREAEALNSAELNSSDDPATNTLRVALRG
jgi:hypothetical protein